MANSYALGAIDDRTGAIVPMVFVTEEPLGNGKSHVTAATNMDYIDYHKAIGDEDEAMRAAARFIKEISKTLDRYAQHILDQKDGK